MIKFFNTLSAKLEEFKPLREGEVGIYTCGPTVYDFAHIGNFRAFVFEDLLRRFLEFSGFEVKHVMNLTDVDDKTIAGAKAGTGSSGPSGAETLPGPCPSLPGRQAGGRRGQAGAPLRRLNNFTTRYVQAFQEDLRTLNILPPNHPAEQPRATQEIPAMLALIQKLIEKGVAYASDGSVYYRVSAFPNYGRLSKKDLKSNLTSARVDHDEYEKEEGADFVLWKKSKEGEPTWDSPWGKGRPGWHIECSAMSMKYLGETFDIHAGGEDLVFPHHENEIAQSEAATGRPFVSYWFHCRHLLVNGEKMSKSKGNFYTLRDLLTKGYDPMAIRYALLSVHYRQPLNFTLEGLKEASEVIRRLDDCYFQCLSVASVGQMKETKEASREAFEAHSFLKDNLNGQLVALADDLNISAALSLFFEAIRGMNSWFPGTQGMDVRLLQAALYFFQLVDKLYGFDIAVIDSIPEAIRKGLEQIIQFRRQKEFEKADCIRQTLVKEDWKVKDARPGEPSTVKKKRRAWD